MSDRLNRMLFAETERRVRNLLAVEQKLANNFDTDPLYENGPRAHQFYIKIRQIDHQPNQPIASFNWTHFLSSLLNTFGHSPINGDTEVHVSESGLLSRLGAIIGQLNAQQISDYLDWQTLWAFLPQMDYQFTRPYMNVTRVKDSLSVRKCPLEKRWMQMDEKCEKFLEWYFPHFLDRLYIQHHLHRGVREEVMQIYANVFVAFRRMLEENSWLEFGAKQRALAKLRSIHANAVYFGRIFDDNYLAKLYRRYDTFRPDVPFAQMVHQMEGTVLGHELSHGFDDWGSYFNSEGVNEDWLGITARSAFRERKQCFVQQYGGQKIKVEGTNLAINGSLTVNENIADNAGLEAAFRAWQLLAIFQAPNQIRALEQFDTDQLFFIHYAFRQCSRMGQVWLRQLLLVGQHSIVPARVNIPLQNLHKFAETFNCPAGSPMNPSKRCKIW